MTENISLIKSSGMSHISLADKLLENKIISLEKKKEVTDRLTGRTEDERMDELLHYLMKSIEVEGKEVFDIFLEILKKEDTRLSLRLAKKLSDAYNAKNISSIKRMKKDEEIESLKNKLEEEKKELKEKVESFEQQLQQFIIPQSGMCVCVCTGSRYDVSVLFQI